MSDIIPVQQITSCIYEIRSWRVMLNRDLAGLYGVETSNLKRQVNRNKDRFPKDFLFELTKEEVKNLRCQIGTSSWGGSRYLPYAFTRDGILMLSSVLNSNRAIQINIQIIRIFNRMVDMIRDNKNLAQKVQNIERRLDTESKAIWQVIHRLEKEAKGIPPAPGSHE